MKLPNTGWLTLGAVAALGSVIVFGDIQWNTTESMPLGLYRTTSAAQLERGQSIRFCLSDAHARMLADRPFLGSGDCPADTQEIAKPIAGVPGDRITHTPAGVSINGVPLPLSPTYPTDSQGQPMPHAPFGERTLREGEYWVHSPYIPRALDSRVVGPVLHDQIRGRWIPLLTWTTPGQGAELKRRGHPR